MDKTKPTLYVNKCHPNKLTNANQEYTLIIESDVNIKLGRQTQCQMSRPKNAIRGTNHIIWKSHCLQQNLKD